MAHKTLRTSIKRLAKLSSSITIMAIITLTMLNFLLWLTDPIGAWDYLNSKYVLATGIVVTTDGYTYKDGVYRMPNWSATIENGNRVTPDTNHEADCVVAAIGDSVTFALGVEDTETWVNYLARSRQDIRFINTGKPGYNITNIRNAMQVTEADYYIYLMVVNDNVRTATFKPENNLRWRYRNPLLAYLTYNEMLFLGVSPPPYIEDNVNFDTELAYLANRDDVLIFALEGNKLQARHDAIVPLPIDRQQYRLSRADGHLNAQGNQTIAGAMLPYLGVVSRECEK